jgi:hypothetical protein
MESTLAQRLREMSCEQLRGLLRDRHLHQQGTKEALAREVRLYEEAGMRDPEAVRRSRSYISQLSNLLQNLFFSLQTEISTLLSG